MNAGLAPPATHRAGGKALVYGLLILFSVFFLTPLVWAALASLK